MDKFDKYFETLGIDKKNIDMVHDRLFSMAKTIVEIFDKNNIDYFIFYGTLLGAVRHGGFIPWDDDFDMYIMDDVYDEAIAILQKELPNDLLVENKDSEPLFFHAWARVKDKNTIVHNELSVDDNLYAHKGVNLDLYRAKRTLLSENVKYRYDEHLAFLKRKLDLNIINKIEYVDLVDGVEKIYEKLFDTKIETDREVISLVLPPFILEVNEIFPLQNIKFYEYEFKSPNNPNSVLEKRYGLGYMDIPAKEDLRLHYNYVEFLK